MKEHDRLERRRIARVATTPEAIGLTGCWQVLVVEREVTELHPKPKEAKPKKTKAKKSKAPAATPAPPAVAPPAAPGQPATTTLEQHYYATSYTLEEQTADALLELVRTHWSAIENGTFHRRDVSLGEDQCRVRHPGAAAALATLRSLTIGLYELARAADQTTANSLPCWCRQQSFSRAYAALRR